MDIQIGYLHHSIFMVYCSLYGVHMLFFDLKTLFMLQHTIAIQKIVFAKQPMIGEYLQYGEVLSTVFRIHLY